MTESSFAQPVPDEWIEAARRGERSAQEALFRRFQRPIYTLALRICQNEDDAMEVMQDTFIKVFASIDQFKHQSPFWGWLRQVAVNMALGRLRKLRRREFTVLGNPPDLVVQRPDDQLDLADAFARLPAETRAVVWLYDVEGYSHREIADLFGKSISFSKTQVSRAHARLRELLDGPSGDPLCTTPVTL